MKELVGDLVVRSQRFALVVSRFSDLVTAKLLCGATDALKMHGCPDEQMTIVRVPGARELALAAKKLADTGAYDAIVCLGCVIRGQTPHFDYVAGAVSRGVARVSLDTGVPVVFGVLTTDTLEQALERAGGKSGNRGADAALTAIEMVNLMDSIAAGAASPGRSAV